MALTKEEAETAFLNNLIGYDTYQQALASSQPTLDQELAALQQAQPQPEQQFLPEPSAIQGPAVDEPMIQQSQAQVEAPQSSPVQKQMDAGVVPEPQPIAMQTTMQAQKPASVPYASGGELEKVYKESQTLYKEADEALKRQEEQRIKDMELQKKRDVEIDDQFNKLKSASESFSKVKDIDPGRFFANASTGAKISALLGAAFGGYAQAYTGGRNVGLDAIDKAINDDIQAQKVNFEKAKNTLEAQESLFGKMYAITKDRNAAELASRAAITDSILKRIDVMSSKAKSAQEVENLKVKKQELIMKAQQEQAALSAKIAEGANANYQAQRIVSGPFAATSKYVVENLPQLIKENKVKIVETPMGVPLVADNEKFAEEAVTANRVHSVMMNNLARLSEIQKGGLLDMNARNEFERLKTNMVSLIKEQKALGTLDNGLLQFSDKMLSGITYQAVTSDPQKAIGQFKKQMDQEYTALLKATYPVMAQNIKSQNEMAQEYKSSGKIE